MQKRYESDQRQKNEYIYDDIRYHVHHGALFCHIAYSDADEGGLHWRIGLSYQLPHIWHYGDCSDDLHTSFSDQFGKRIEEYDKDDLYRPRKAVIGGMTA